MFWIYCNWFECIFYKFTDLSKLSMIELSSYQKFKIKISLRIITFGAFLGAFFVFANKGFIENYHHYYNGIVSGIVIGLFISIVEVYVFARNARKIKFFWFLLIRLGVYTISLVFILVHVAVISQMIRMEESYSEVWSSKTIQFYIYGVLALEFVSKKAKK